MSSKLISANDMQPPRESRWLSIRDIATDLAISLHTA